MRRVALVILLAAVMIIPAGFDAVAFGYAEITPDDIEAALEERRAAGARLADITDQYEASVVERESLKGELSNLGVELGLRERELTTLRVEAKNIARELYMGSGAAGITEYFDLETLTDVEIRQGYLELVADTDQATLTRLQALESSYRDQRVLLASASARQSEVVDQLDSLGDQIIAELEAADQAYRDIVSAYEEQEAEKRRRAEEAARRAAEEAARAAAGGGVVVAAVVVAAVVEAAAERHRPLRPRLHR